MKILYHHRIGSKDGQYVHIEELVGALEGLGHDVRIVAPSRFHEEQFGGESPLILRLKRSLPKWLYELAEFGYCFIDFCRLVREAFRYRPDLLYERFNLLLPSGIWASRLLRIPLFLEINAPVFEERCRYDGVALHRLARWSQRYAWRGATKCLPVTRVLAGYVERAGVSHERIVVIPNGINEEAFSHPPLRRGTALPSCHRGNVVLGFVGFVRVWHGLEKAIELIAEPALTNREASLLIVGDGPARDQLQQKASDLGVAERVHFTGLVGRDEVRDYIEMMDVALQPMVVGYASPLKLFEYMFLGRAIVAPSLENIREVLTDGENALLFDPSDEGAMEAAIIRLVRDTELRERLGRAAKLTISACGYTWKQNAERIVQLFFDQRQEHDK